MLTTIYLIYSYNNLLHEASFLQEHIFYNVTEAGSDVVIWTTRQTYSHE